MRTLTAMAAMSITIWALAPQARADGEESGSSTASDAVQSAKNIGKAVVEGAKRFGGNIVKHVIRGATRLASGGSTSQSSKSATSTASDVVQSAKNIGGALVEGAKRFGGNIVKHLGRAAARRASGSQLKSSWSPGHAVTRVPMKVPVASVRDGRSTLSTPRKPARAVRRPAAATSDRPVPARRRKRTSRRR